MVIFQSPIPPVPHFTEGTPRDRILAVMALARETDMGVLALRTELDMEVVYHQLTVLLSHKLVVMREDRRGYPVFTRATPDAAYDPFGAS